MSDSPEGRRVDAYLDTVKRLEPDIAPLDVDAAMASIAISLRRIADVVCAKNGFEEAGLLALERMLKGLG